jgi:hypothetical protein
MYFIRLPMQPMHPFWQWTPPQGKWHLYQHAHRRSPKHATISCHHHDPHAHLQGCNPTWHRIGPQKLFRWDTPLILSIVPPQQIAPPTPTPIPPPKPLCRSQRIANLGIPTANTRLNNTPAHNIRNQVQYRTISQEAILACMNTYNYICSRSPTPVSAAHHLFPIKILNAVLDKNNGKLL